jgi:outer membrane protein assembly factor BamB
MSCTHRLTSALALLCYSIPACAGTMVYVINAPANGPTDSSLFGTVDLSTGKFKQIGAPARVGGSAGLAPGPNGKLFTLAVGGDLDAIDPATGVTIDIGPTGLEDCTSPASPCGPKSANALASLGGVIYATDFANNLYRVNATTGTAMLVGPTGIPAVPAAPLTVNPDGTLNGFEQGLFSANGMLYSTFQAFTFDAMTFATKSIVEAPKLYRIDPTTGATSIVGPTDLNLEAVADVGGTVYAFKDFDNQIVKLNLSNGQTSFVHGFDPALGFVTGVAPTPEPASIALMGIGLIGLGLCGMARSRRTRCFLRR